MFKFICKETNCANKGISYYFIETTEITICGGCKIELKATKMSQTEFDKVFDYDPYKVSTLNV
jgi:hypothetical protein